MAPKWPTFARKRHPYFYGVVYVIRTNFSRKDHRVRVQYGAKLSIGNFMSSFSQRVM